MRAVAAQVFMASGGIGMKGPYKKAVVGVVVVMILTSTAGSAAPLEVFVSIAPQAYLVERIGGEHVTVNVLLAAGREPHTFEPTPKQVMGLGRARLYFQVGTLPFERRLAKKLAGGNTGLVAVDTSKGVRLRPLEAHDPHVVDEHRAGLSDPHIWLGPRSIAVQARNIDQALSRVDQGHARVFKKNLEGLLEELARVDAGIRKVLAPYQGRTVYVFHPSFGYFTDAYGLKQRAVEIHGKTPSPRQIQSLIREAKADGVRVIFVQPQFDKSSAEVVARAIGGVVAPVDPLARDLLGNLRDMAGKIEGGFAGES